MRLVATLLILVLMSACTALVVGGAAVGGYQPGKDEREPAVVASDSAITAMIKGQFVADTTVGVFNISVRTYEGSVTLTGAVGNYVTRDQAGRIAKGTKGVKSVNNQIVVEN